MNGWQTFLTFFLVAVGAGYTFLVYSVSRRDDEEQHRNAGNHQP